MRRFFVLLSVLMLLPAVFAVQMDVKFNFPLGFTTSDTTSMLELDSEETAFDAFDEAATLNDIILDVTWYDFDGDGLEESPFINAIDGLGTSADWTQYWQFSINNTQSMEGAGDYVPMEGDVISLDYLEGPIPDAIEWLADNQESNGRFGDNIFQSAFGFMGATLAAQNGITLDDSVSENGISYFLSLQENDAGFGNDLYTSVAVMSLLSGGPELDDFLKNGDSCIDLLEQNQENDGGFKSGTGESDVDTTSWASIAFTQSGLSQPEKNGNKPKDYLFSAQHANGAWSYNSSDTSDSVDFSSEALIALAALGESSNQNTQNGVSWLLGEQLESGCYADGFRTAIASIALRMNGNTDEADNASNCLKTLVNGDGSFGRSSNSSNALDTGLAVIALSSETLPLTISESQGTEEGLAGLNSTIKFFVRITNTGRVKAENVEVRMEGIPEEWVLSSDEGSVDFFEKILPGQTKTAEIYVKMKETGNYSVIANVQTRTRNSLSTSTNSVSVKVEEASLSVSIDIDE